MYFNLKTLICFIIFVQFLFGQETQKEFEKELKIQNSAIESLKKEIERTKKRIQSESKKEQSSVRKVSSLSEEISLIQRLIKEIKKEESNLLRDIKRTESQINKSEKELDELRLRYSKRLKKIYKKGDSSPLEKVLSSTSWRQAIYRAKYLKIISEIDKKTYNAIRSLLIQIGKQKLQLETALRRKINLKNQREKALSSLRLKKKNEQRELAKIRQSQKDLKSYLTEKQAE